MFILMLIVCWIITLNYSPEIIQKNGLKDIIGYDNLCVGFDAPPARYVAMPMQVMMAVLACRYSSLDTTRAALEFTHGNITRSQYWCSYVANNVYAGFLCCFPMLLVLTPDLSAQVRDIHTCVSSLVARTQGQTTAARPRAHQRSHRPPPPRRRAGTSSSV